MNVFFLNERFFLLTYPLMMWVHGTYNFSQDRSEDPQAILQQPNRRRQCNPGGWSFPT